ncbi:MAG: WG repeat-containing protein, partial [Clostridia bacterium]|nr:WG repeat-containing protein [Clostridia bacterium]
DGRTELFRLDEANLEVAAVGGAIVAVNAESLRIYDRTGTLRRTCAPNAAVVEGARGQLILSEGDWGSQTVRIIDESGAKIDRVDQHLIPLDDERYAFVSMNVALYNSDILGGTRYSVNYDSLRVGMIDRTGREIVPAEYEEIRAVGENRYLLIGERALILCNEEGKTIWQKKL